MADTSVSVKDAAGTTIPIDGFSVPGGDIRQTVVVGDAATAQAASVDAYGRLNVNVAGSAGTSPSAAGSITAAAASTITGTASTTGSVVIDVSAAGNASFHLVTAAFVGTVVFEQSFDPAGAAGTWMAVPAVPEDSTVPVTQLAINTAVAYVRQYTVPMFGPALFRVRASVFTSGSLAVLLKAGPGWVESQPSLAESTKNIGTVDLGAATSATGTAVNNNATANTNSQVLAADPTRKGVVIYNTHASAIVLIGYGFATTSAIYSARLQPGQGVEVPPQFAKLAMNAQSTVASSPLAVTAGVGL